MASRAAKASAEVKSVLIAYDFSEAAQKPLRHALAVARHYGAKFHLVNVVSSLGYTIVGPQAANLAAERTQRDARRLEKELLASGALAGLEHEFIIREGEVWEQLELVIKEKKVDLVVVGTHGRGSLGKLILGSVAERVFRNAECLVGTVGPGSYEDALTEKTGEVRPFLFATDFGVASLHALPYALSFASHFKARLIVLHVLPAAPIPEGFHWSTTGDLDQMRERARVESERQFGEMIRQSGPMETQPEFMVKYGIPSDQILLASHMLRSDLIILGLRRPAHSEVAAHTPWDIAYKVVSSAYCPVLTIRN
ncbi:MAG TPA: universal stress protein [Terriglobales bacterium]|nr:universal stress protein [Terriglobales bacterium]